MDTILVNNIVVPQKIDSLRIISDDTGLLAKIDSLSLNTKESIDGLTDAIITTNAQQRIIDWISNDALFTVLTMILVLLLGTGINALIKYINREIEKKKTIQYFKYHINKVIDSYTDKVSKAYRKVYLDSTINSGIPLTPPEVLSSSFERINKIDSKELFHSTKKKETLSKILAQTDFQGKINEKVNYYHIHARDESNLIRLELEGILENYIALLIEFCDFEKANNPDYKTDPHFSHFNATVVKFMNEYAGQRKITEFYKEILKPMQKYLVDNKLYPEHEIAKKVAKSGRKLSDTYNKLRMLTFEYKLEYRRFYFYVINSRNDLKQEMENINWR